MQIPVVESDAEDVPGWVKNTAGWWAEDKINGFTLVRAIEYLISQGIMTVDEKQEAEELPICPDKMISDYACIPKEVVVISDFYMEVNGHSCSYCVAWAYVGNDYRFQIETFDKKHGSHIDGVTITAKIISKDGELRYDFGEVTTEDGLYRNSVTVPSMDGETPFVVNLNFNVTPGSYRLVQQGSIDMTRDSSGNTYPYAIGAVGDVTGGTYGSGSASSSYYYFYNWI